MILSPLKALGRFFSFNFCLLIVKSKAELTIPNNSVPNGMADAMITDFFKKLLRPIYFSIFLG